MPRCENCGFHKDSKSKECSECNGEITFDPTLETRKSPSFIEKHLGETERWQFVVAAPIITLICLYTYSIAEMVTNIVPIIIIIGTTIMFISDISYVSKNTDWNIDSNTWIVLCLISLVTTGIIYFLVTPFYMYYRVKLTNISVTQNTSLK